MLIKSKMMKELYITRLFYCRGISLKMSIIRGIEKGDRIFLWIQTSTAFLNSEYSLGVICYNLISICVIIYIPRI